MERKAPEVRNYLRCLIQWWNERKNIPSEQDSSLTMIELNSTNKQTIMPASQNPVPKEEIWYPIPEWEGIYEASSFGNIRSVARKISRPHPKNPEKVQERIYGGKVLSPKLNRNGYLEVQLWYQDVPTTASVHRLVCSAFHGKSSYRDVNHKDGNKTNNYKENLEWMTHKQNCQHREQIKSKLADNITKN